MRIYGGVFTVSSRVPLGSLPKGYCLTHYYYEEGNNLWAFCLISTLKYDY